MSNHHYYNNMNCEKGVAESLLKLHHQPSQHFATLKPIHSLQQEENNQRLPSLSNLLLPPHNYQQQETNNLYLHANNSWGSGSTANLLYSPNDDTSSIYSTNGGQHSTLIPPLSHSSSFSSLRSVKSNNQKTSLLSRAATFTARRRGRPRKSTITQDKNEIKIVDMSCYNYQGESTTTSTESVTSSPSNKPRWQEAERLELLEAIVKEKELDDMTTIRWDRISLAVGRAKKACKDQWRRELLPNLMKGLRPNSNKKRNNDS